MVELIRSKVKLRADSSNYIEFEKCIEDLIKNENVQSMRNYIQHSSITCFEHSVYVSYTSYMVCRFLGLNYYAAARGGLLHDFFLYDWHVTKLEVGLHGFTHPDTALVNANKFFCLSDMEKDIIAKHMWPLTAKLPRYKESIIVLFVDKYCATMEILKLNKRTKFYEHVSTFFN